MRIVVVVVAVVVVAVVIVVVGRSILSLAGAVLGAPSCRSDETSSPSSHSLYIWYYYSLGTDYVFVSLSIGLFVCLLVCWWFVC